MRRAKLVLVLAATGVGLLLMLQNRDSVDVKLLTFEFPIPKVILAAAMLLIGFALGAVFGQRLKGSSQS